MRITYDKWRSCFLYCALYPDGHFIHKDALVDRWICEDFWDNNDLTREARDEAHSIIDTLVRSCLLEVEGQYVKMHDVIREMALRLENGNSVVVAGMQSKKGLQVEKWEGVRRLSLMFNNIEKLSQMPQWHKLVTLFLNHNRELHEVNEDFFRFMGALTVLDLSFTKLKKLPKSIKKLVSLQYLSIERTAIEELPVELGALKLKSLNVGGLKLKAKRSDRLLFGMPSLQVLKMLRCSYRYRKEEWPEKYTEEILLDELDHLEHLKELQFTVMFVNSLERLNMESRKLLTTITALHLLHLEGSRFLNICLLEDMKYLSVIDIHDSDLEKIYYVAMKIRRAAAFVRVSISSSSLHMETSISFSYVRSVSIMQCNHLKDLTTMLVLLSNLTTLLVKNCDSMEEMISSSNAVNLVFSRLSKLQLWNLPRLRHIYQNPLPFPQLSDLLVLHCNLLKKLPLDSSSRDGPKIRLEAMRDWWEAIEWTDDATKVVLLPRFQCTFH